MINRKDIAAQLSEAAKLMEVLGEDPYRARSFHVAARAFEGFGGDVDELFRSNRLTELQGVGSGTEAELRAMLRDGVMPVLAELRSKVPDEVKEMFAVSGLGAKRIGTLWRSGIVGIEALVVAAEDGRLASLPGFGAKSAANIAEAAHFAALSRARMRLDEAERLTDAILAAVEAEYPAVRVAAAGDYRRGLETVEGLEFVVAGLEDEQLLDLGERLLDESLGPAGDGSVSGELMGRRVRFSICSHGSFGAVLALRTGGPEYGAGLLERAAQRGLDLSVRGTGAGFDFHEEEDFLRWLELAPVPPELRETADPVPVTDLLQLADVRGLVHNHSTWSDGALSLAEMVEVARSFGFSYLATADHSVSSTVANGLSEERLLAQAAEVRSLREDLLEGTGFELLHGIELDIRADGTLDYPDDVLAQLDYCVASVHQNFGLSRARQTERIVRAVQNPHVHILGHPTGRLLLRRPGYEVDLDEVIAACAATDTVIEINANPRRLDLDWRWVRRAKDLGCRFSINPDAHTGDGFDDLRYGVVMARKAGLTPSDVVNTAPTGGEFLARIETTDTGLRSH